MNRIQCPNCGHKLKYPDNHAGMKAKCEQCGHSFRLPSVATTSSDALARFSALGYFIGSAAIIIGCLWIAGGIGVSLSLNRGHREFNPAALIIFGLIGLLWATAGGLLLILRRRFALLFWIFLLLNFGVGTLLCVQPRSMGFTAGDARFWAAIGLALIVSATLVQLFHGFLMRDLRRQAKSAKKAAISSRS